MIGVDVSDTMIATARLKAGPHWELGDCAALPFASNSFGGATCMLAIHHFPDVLSVFREAFRVLRPGGCFVLFLFWPDQVEQYWLANYFPRMIANIAARTPGRDTTFGALKAAGFQDVRDQPWFVPPDLQDFFLYSGKHAPERYLDPAFRAGASSFRLLTSADEVESGVARLRDDLESGRFDEVRCRFLDDLGDYALVTAKKPVATR
jgi:SAM-dependent methyltransferase